MSVFTRPTVTDAMRLDTITELRRERLRPDQESAIRRWASRGGNAQTMTPGYWRWLLTPDSELGAFLAKTPDETAAFLADWPEAPDGPTPDRRPRIAQILRPRTNA